MVPQWIPNLRHRLSFTLSQQPRPNPVHDKPSALQPHLCTSKSLQGSKAATALTFKREVPCASLHKDKAKMHASEAAASLSSRELGSDQAPALSARSYTSRKLGSDQVPTLTHLLRTSESARSYTSLELGSDQAPALTHLLGMSESARSYTSHALPSVTNLLPRKKKSQSSKCQSSGKENWGSNVNMVSLLIPPSKMAAMSRAVSLSPEDNRMTF